MEVKHDKLYDKQFFFRHSGEKVIDFKIESFRSGTYGIACGKSGYELVFYLHHLDCHLEEIPKDLKNINKERTK